MGDGSVSDGSVSNGSAVPYTTLPSFTLASFTLPWHGRWQCKQQQCHPLHYTAVVHISIIHCRVMDDGSVNNSSYTTLPPFTSFSALPD